ncbi:MAG: hypothetical protein KQH57_03050 [Actinomycetales bacterium]|nr:hypothetical protein [Actinomycetales bacterium]
MHQGFRKRAAAVLVAVLMSLGAVTVTAGPASASAASAAFSRCMDPYLAGQRTAYSWHQDKVALAILYTGYANCYLDLSQRSDISNQTEINAINNYNRYYAKAQVAIANAGLTYYKSMLKLGLKGLRL